MSALLKERRRINNRLPHLAAGLARRASSPAKWDLETTSKPPAAPWKWPRWLFLALLAGYFLFAHGCHRDDDTELSVRHVIMAASTP